MEIVYRLGRATVAEVLARLSGTPAYSHGASAQLGVLGPRAICGTKSGTFDTSICRRSRTGR